MLSFLRDVTWPWTPIPHATDVRDALNHSGLTGRIPTLPTLLPLAHADARLLRVRGEKGNTLLHAATRAGDAAAVQTLLSLGADARARDADGAAPLAYVPRGAVHIAEALVRGGADVNGRDIAGGTALLRQLEFAEGVSEVAWWLLRNGADGGMGADEDRIGEWTYPMDEAARLGCVELGVALVNAGAGLMNEGVLAGARKEAFLGRVREACAVGEES